MNFDEFISETGISFNEQQLTAIKQIDGAFLLLAVPGSGKTTTIIARLGYMVRAMNIPTNSILTITYTRAATQSMKSRYIELFGSDDGLEFRTIHGICAKILYDFEQQTGRRLFRLIESDGEVSRIISELYTEIAHTKASEADLKEVKSLITYHRNMLSTAEEIASTELDGVDFPKLFDTYKKYKISHRLMDHDDQLEYAYTMLKSYPQFLESYRRKYHYINVDEAQDTSKLQHEIIRLLANKNIFMVGDEDQSIYGFRAAYPDALLKFSEYYPNGKTLFMETNYRSTKQIVDYALDFIQHNSMRYSKKMISAQGLGCEPRLVSLYDFSNCYSYLASLLKDTEVETAILYRNNESVIPLVDILLAKNISFTLTGNDAVFFSSRTVIAICDVLRFVLQPDNESYFMKAYYRLGASIKKEEAQRAVQYSKQHNNPDFFDCLMKLGLVTSRTMPRISRLSNMVAECRELNSRDAIMYAAFKLMPGYHFAKPTADRQKLKSLLVLAAKYQTIPEFFDALNSLQSILKDGVKGDNDSKVTLSTIHSSKGLEYDRVILIDVKNGVLPSAEIKDTPPQEQQALLEEDRRVFYVACTRAIRELIIFSSDRECGLETEQSQFINEYFKIQPKVTIKKFAKRQEKKQKEVVTREATSSEIQKQLRDKLTVGNVITHKQLGKCRVASNNGKIVRVVVINDGIVKALDVDFIVKFGLIE